LFYPNRPAFIQKRRCHFIVHFRYDEHATYTSPARKQGVRDQKSMTARLHAIGESFVASTAVVLGDVVLGPGANVWYGVVIRGDLATITLGPRVNLQDGCIVHTDRDEPQTIEEGVVVGHAAVLHGRRIGKDTLIAMGAKLLSGSEVGPECVIAAGTLVTEGKVIPPRSLVMGMPGKVVRSVTDDEVARTRRIAEHYLEMAQRHARGEFVAPWKKSQ
jgi:carbonic anhydrase/acetyltransferase-like protein (isoleucine patch superfamily)